MNGIAKGLHISGTKYSQQTVEEGTKVFCNFLKRVEVDNYIKEQSELADGTNALLDFIKRVKKENLFKQHIQQIRHLRFIQPKRPIIRIINLTLKPNSLQKPLNIRNEEIQQPSPFRQEQPLVYNLGTKLNKNQIEYLNNQTLEILNKLNKKQPLFHKRHFVSDVETNALVNIFLCKKFNIKRSNQKELENKIINFGKILNFQKISYKTAQNYFKLINCIFNEQFGQNYKKEAFCWISPTKLLNMSNLIVKELNNLNSLKNS